MRGEGALLLDARGERFVDELAPRDEVALAIEHGCAAAARARSGWTCAPVDLGRFPNIAATLAEAGIDPAREPVPVAPGRALHDGRGGGRAGRARRRCPGCYAVGECACTGLHGANRLASNSLAECFVFGRRAALAALAEPPPPAAPRDGPPPAPPRRRASAATREALWRLAGLERDAAGLAELAGDPFPLARLIAAAALAREESRGAHQRLDHPTTDPRLDGRHVSLAGRAESRFEAWDLLTAA